MRHDARRSEAGKGHGHSHTSRGLIMSGQASPAPLLKSPPKPHFNPVPEPEFDIEIGVIYTYEINFMAHLLASLEESDEAVRHRFIFVDNASNSCMETWTAAVKHSHLVVNQQRLGYAANLNRILEASTARYVLLLNTDMVFPPLEQCVSKMVRFMDEHPDCGLSGCRLYHPTGEYAHPARRFPTVRTVIARRSPLKLFGGALRDHLYLERDPKDVFECDWLSGCFLMVRREAINDVGMFDESFGKYFEDVDMGLRMTLAGWRVMFNGQTYCYHHEQRASKRVLNRDFQRHLRAYGRWLLKWGFDPLQNTAEQSGGSHVASPHFGARRRASATSDSATSVVER